MKRSEAMDNLSDIVAKVESEIMAEMPADMGSVYLAAIALLNAQDDLPWRVELHSSPSGQGYYPNVLVARCNSEHAAMHAAKLWGVQYATISCTVQTVDHDEQKPTESEGCPARDLLNAEEDAIADMPWRVIDDVDGSVAAFELEQDARCYASEVLFDEATITGPTQPVCDDEDEQTESKGCPGCGGLTEWDREDPPNPYYCNECAPWDGMPAFEGDPDDCAFKHPPRLVPVTEQIVEVDGKYYRVVIE